MKTNTTEKLKFGKNDVLGVRGSFGTVYKGKLDGELDVAIKQVDKKKTRVAKSQFYYNANGHPNILNFFCLVAHDSKFTFIVTELCAVNLQDFVLSNYKTPPMDISPKEILHQILKGVHHLHLLEVVHGNLKPTNILVSSPKGDLGSMFKVADFGLCHHAKENGSKEQHFLPAHTEGWFCPIDPMDEKGQRSLPFDIFPLALLFGFVASKGVHPHGSNLEEAIRCIRNKNKMMLTLEKIDESIRRVSFLDLLNQMLNYEDSKRPTTSQILDHLFFKIEMRVPVQQDEKELLNAEPLMLSPSNKANTPSRSKFPVKKKRSVLEEISHFAGVADSSCKEPNESSARRSLGRRKIPTSPDIEFSSGSDDNAESSMVNTTQSSSLFDLVKSLPSLRKLPTRSTKLTKVIPLANPGHEIPGNMPVSTLPAQQESGSDDSDSEKSADSPNWAGEQRLESSDSSSDSSSSDSTESSNSSSPRIKKTKRNLSTTTAAKKTNRGTKKKPQLNFQCEVCEKRFKSNYHLSRHTITHTGVKPFVCEACGLRFTQKVSVESHIKAVHDKVKTFECELCSKTFARKSDLLIHMNIHTGRKPYECTQCDKFFADPSALRSHRKSHSKSSKKNDD